jgi:hypothetical protein
MKRFVTLAAAGLVLSLSGLSAFADDVLSQKELRRLFPGSFQAVVHGSIVLKIVAHSNGSLTGVYSGKTDKGRWSVSNGRLCVALDTWMSGKSSCSAVVAEAGWYRGNGVKSRKL